MRDAITSLSEMSVAPSEEAAFNRWLELRDAITFLVDNANGSDFVLYAAVPYTLIHAFVVPVSSMNDMDPEDLMRADYGARHSWGFTWTLTDPPVVSISCPPETGSKTLDTGEQLVFARHFEGRLGTKDYYEILQKLVHLFDLHFLEERNAYCRLDKRGDIEDVIRIVELPERGHTPAGTVIFFRRGILDKYLVLTDSVLIRSYDFTRYRPMKFSGWSEVPKALSTNHGTLVYRSAIESGNAGYVRGYQIVRPLLTKEEVLADFAYPPKETKQYVSFIAHDWKNKVVKEISCAPGHTANYFTKSDLPFELSPAFLGRRSS
jgi:hypothetical protein